MPRRLQGRCTRSTSFIAPSRLLNGRFALQLPPPIDDHISACKAPRNNLLPQLAPGMAPLCPALVEVRAIRIKRTVGVSCSGSLWKPARLHIPAHGLATEV